MTREGFWTSKSNSVLLALESWKSVDARNQSKIIANDSGRVLVFKTMLIYIGTEILEVCSCQESVKDNRIMTREGFKTSKPYSVTLTPESWKSTSASNQLKTNANDLGGFRALKPILSYIVIGILEVCECQDSVKDHPKWLGRGSEPQNHTQLHWQWNPGTLRVLGINQRQSQMTWLGFGTSKPYPVLLAPESWKSTSARNQSKTVA